LPDHPPTPKQEALRSSAFDIGFDLEDALRAVLVPHHSSNHSGYLSGNPSRHHKQTFDTGERELEVEGRELEDVYADERVVSRLFKFLKVEPQHQDWNKNGRAIAWVDGQPNPLPAVYAANKRGGRFRKMGRQEHAVWGRRLLHDSGVAQALARGC
jgi:hypothetical protein